ncbi:hypothetical protein [Planococcus dechangensis]|uniref:Uncharacterized protein n=1 Tax=Planococcus dechangensis TaxID=1176255 RepID=A0ABV9MFI6_9BACL
MVIVAKNQRDLEINRPTEYEKLYLFEKMMLSGWIVNTLLPYKIKSYNSPTSYRLKHIFEKSPTGFYISNGVFKGAMLNAGFTPKDEQHLNWTFTLSRKLNNIDPAKLPRW